MAKASTTTPAIPPEAPIEAPKPRVPYRIDSATLRAKYDELAAQTTAMTKAGNDAELKRLRPAKAAAFKAWKDSLKPAELAEKERARRRFGIA